MCSTASNIQKYQKTNNIINFHSREHVEIMQNTLHKYYDDPYMECQ